MSEFSTTSKSYLDEKHLSLSVQESHRLEESNSKFVVGASVHIPSSLSKPTISPGNYGYIHVVTSNVRRESTPGENEGSASNLSKASPNLQTNQNAVHVASSNVGGGVKTLGMPKRHSSSDSSNRSNSRSKSNRSSTRNQDDSSSLIKARTNPHLSSEAKHNTPEPQPMRVSSDSHKYVEQQLVLPRTRNSSSTRDTPLDHPADHPEPTYSVAHSQNVSPNTSSLLQYSNTFDVTNLHHPTQAQNIERQPQSHTSHQPHSSLQQLAHTTTAPPPLPRPLIYSESDPDYQAVKSAAECLHAHDYTKMANILEREPNNSIPVLFGKGLAYYKLTKYSAAIRAFEQMLQESENDPELLGNVYLAHYYIGEIDLGHGRYDQASRHFEQAADAFCTLTIAKRYRIIAPSLAILYSKKGSALNHSHKVMAAVKSYKKAIELGITAKDKLAACTSLGNLYQSLGDNQNAMKQYEDTIQLAEELNDFVYLGWAHGNMGNAYLGLNQKDKALFHLEKSLELTINNEPSPQAIGRAYNNLGTAHQSLNDVTKAEEYYDLALSQAIYGRDVGGQARAYGNIGNLLMIQKKYESAILHYTEAMTISKDLATKSTAFHNRGCASYEKAESDIKKFFDRLQSQSDGTPHSGLALVTYKGPNVNRLPQAPSHLPSSINDLYEQGRNDLLKVVEHHEETIQTIKGSTQGLTLSVSLSETNSRSFHRLQDCLYNLGEWGKALECAEQSRARSLGELMLERKGRSLDLPLTSPLTTQQINQIIDRVGTTVVYISYTGSRLLVWVFSPVHGHMTTNMLQVTLSDDQFEGKSLDYYLRYSLSEILIESNMEMYSVSTYEEETSPLTMLFDLLGKPLLNVLESVHSQTSSPEPKDIILIPDSYTNLMPVLAFLDHANQKFLGDKYRFRYMPSLLTLGILWQLPEVVVEVLLESRSFCIVGNPTIPTFNYQGDTWSLGKLPHATKEAEWVAHILKCNPTLHDQATKMLVLSMMNTAKVIHLATHGSAVTGFLAFAGRGSSRSKEVVDDKKVLLYPDEVEKLSISPALVVLSSCDSGRGVVKADGIQGMARAFILAGAQSVLTSLWRVPDESASTFMQFFYQYLMDGFKSSSALQKAILSVRAFSKYSRYIHWSGYQLTGREVCLVAKKTAADLEIREKVGVTAVFPRLNVIKKLEAAFMKEPRTPTDVQLIHGVHGLKPSEPVIDFITKYHTHFSGGVFWVNGSSPEFIRAAEFLIQKALATSSSPLMETTLVVLDNLFSLPEPGPLLTLLRSNHTHIITLSHTLSPPENLQKEFDLQLIRGLDVISLKPLSRLHSTQRMVHSVALEHDFVPHTGEQEILAKIADNVGGSPPVVDISSALLKRCIQECEAGGGEEEDFLREYEGRVFKKDTNSIAKRNDQSITEFTSNLIEGFKLTQSEQLLLTSLAMFGPVPIPKSVVEKAQSFVMMAKPSTENPGSLMPISNLLSAKLLLVYPSPVIAPPSNNSTTRTAAPRLTNRRGSTDSAQLDEEADYFYVPQLVKDSLWESLRPLDQEIAITTSYKCLEQLDFSNNSSDLNVLFGGGLTRMLIELLESKGRNVEDKTLLSLSCYQELVKLYVNFRIGNYGSV